MLLFIYGLRRDYENKITFQYITCYSLSQWLQRTPIRLTCFNTSHVTLYQVPVSLADRLLLCFNTSHVTLYHMGRQREYGRKVFQYITCYSLSIDHPKYGQYVWMFQYITCYSLSVCPDVQFFGYKVFQYITCYSLSNLQSSKIIVCRSFNTSHVTLYPDGLEEDEYIYLFQYITCYSLSNYNCSRTADSFVSIHHMLLFILAFDTQWLSKFMFQYITCYSLSLDQAGLIFAICLFQYITCYSLSTCAGLQGILFLVSIHHMLLFISCQILLQLHHRQVSIHHMLLFISYFLRTLIISQRSFNTSHVTLYHCMNISFISLETSFNTSHVTLYPCERFFISSFVKSFNTSHVTLYRL